MHVPSDTELVGVQEAGEMLGISRGSLNYRRKHGEPLFPEPIAVLSATAVWTREQIEEYARARAEVWHERPGVEALARESSRDSIATTPRGRGMALPDAAAAIGVAAARVAAVADSLGVAGLDATGEVVDVDPSALGLIARECGSRRVEIA